MSGKVLSYKIDGDSLSFVLNGKEKVQVFYTISSEEEKNVLEETFGIGIVVHITGTFDEAKENVIPNTFNYKKYLYYQHILKLFYANHLEIKKEANFFNQWKNNITRYLKSLPHSKYFLTFILGNTKNFDMSDIRENGVSHLFAISGMHFSFFILVLGFLLRKWKRIGTIILSFFLLFYVWLVSFTPSVMRVFLMYHFDILNKKFGNIYTKRQMFFIVFSFFLLYDSFLLMNLGFQYSFLISFCFTFLEKNQNYMVNLLKTSLVSFLATLPITAMNFYEVNLLSIFFNLIFVPFVSFILYPFCFLVICFPFFMPIYGFLLNIFELLNHFFSTLHFGVIVIPKTSIILYFIYYFFFFCYLCKKRKEMLVFLFLLVLGIKCLPKFSLASYVYFLDVSQGDCSVFISPHQKEIIMIDTGGKVSFSKESWQLRMKNYQDADTLITFLHSLGITHISTLVLTHGDYDHLGNALNILKEISVSKIVLNRNEKNDIETQIANKYQSKLSFTLTSSFFQIQDFTISSFDNENDSSLIFKIGVYNKFFLMMGDASKIVEEKLISKNIQSDVIKIGHHGSKTSTGVSFIKRVQPTYAVISVALNNKYGHPSQDVMNTLRSVSVSTLMTSEVHTICFKVTKNSLKYIPIFSFS